MRLSKEQLEHLQQAARFASGRAAGRDPSVTDKAVPPGFNGRSDRAMVDVIRATEQVARAADNVIRAAHDETPPIRPAAVNAPADPEIFVSATPPPRGVELPPFVPPRRSRIPMAVALLALAFGAGAGTSWLVFTGPARTRDQAWNLVSWVLETGKALPQLPAALDPLWRRSEHPVVAVAPKEGAVPAKRTGPARPTTQPAAAAPPEPVDPARYGPAPESGLVPPPASVSAFGTAPAKIAAPPTAGPAGIASGEPSAAGVAPPPSPGVGVLEPDPGSPSVRPGERPLSGIVLGALPGARPRTAEKAIPDVSQSAANTAPPSAVAAEGPPTEEPATEGLAVCLASRPANLRLAREETARLLKRGEEFMGEGRVSAARLVFKRAAEACDVRAAFALGASYDPIMLQKLGVALLDPDISAARSWYERAKELGSSEASQELELLSNWHQ